MLVIRNVFRCKPGKAGELAGKMRKMVPLMEQEGGRARVLVDLVGPFWTVVLETEAADLATFEKSFHERSSSEEMAKASAGYMDLVEEGHREIFAVAE